MNESELKLRLDKSLEYLKTELGYVKTGRATPSLIENISVSAYGSKMNLKELGSINLLDNQTLVISPWDKSLLSSIAKAIRESDLNLNPAEDNDRIRIPIPPLTEERRKELAKKVSIQAEEAKQSIRSIRQDAMKDIDNAFLSKSIGEDEKFARKEKIENIIKDYIKQIDDIGESKKSEIMRV